MSMYTVFLVLLFAVPAAIVVKGMVERRKQSALEARGPVSLVGCMGTTVGTMGPGLPGKIVVIDAQGEKHHLSARLEDVVIPVRPGQEVLVIEDPDEGGLVVVVPATDIPRLEVQD